jgi:peptide/nickel transport system substrate-binding protein
VRGTKPRLAAAVLASLAIVGSGAQGSAPVAAAEAPQSSFGVRSDAGSQTTLTISAADGETWPCSFNPFNPNTYFFSLGLVNEELYYINSVGGTTTPWLATGYKWSDNAKVLTWTIRRGVRFSNGQPLTAADVAFTFNLIKKNPDIDLNAIDPTLKSVAQTGPYQVTMKFRAPAATLFYYIADQIGIVPKSIWSKVKHPLTYQDSDPIGTGPYTVGACTPQNVSYVKNPGFWQPGRPKFDRVEVPAIITNSVANEMLADGSAQWGGQFIPNIKAYYLARNKDYRTWSPGGGYHGVYINLKDPVLSQLPVRQAMAYGINRAQVAKLAVYGEVAPANQSGVLLPSQKAWYNAPLAAKYNYAYDPAKAISVLKKAGYKRGPGGIFETPSGQPLAFRMIDVGGYSDMVSSVQVVSADLAKIGIKITPVNLSTPAFSADMAEGHFQLGYAGPPGTTLDGPFSMMRGLLYSGNSAPIGKPAASNFERFSSAREDALINKMNSVTNTGEAERLMKQIEAPMLTEVPFIPVANSAAWNQYNVGFASGWPTAANPYANPSPTTQPDEEVVLLHLVPKG